VSRFAIAAVGSLLVASLVGCGGAKDVDLVKAWKPFECPPGAIEAIEPWGISGVIRSCMTKDGRIRNGRFVAAENGRLALSGTYVNGSKSGVWQWYDEQGRSTKQIDYTKQEDSTP
jgi:hypothetical protein